MNSKDLKASLKCFNFIGLFQPVLTAYLLVTAFNIAPYFIKIESVSNFLSGFSVVNVMILAGIPIFIVSLVQTRYNLLSFLPMKASTVPAQMSLSIDILHIANAITETIIFIVTDKVEYLPLKFVTLLIIYINAHITLAMSVTPGLSQSNMVSRRVGTGILLVYIQIIVFIAAMILNTLTVIDKIKSTGKYFIICAVALGVLAVASIVVRVLTYKNIRNKVRLIKVYKPKKVKKPDEYAYI